MHAMPDHAAQIFLVLKHSSFALAHTYSHIYNLVLCATYKYHVCMYMKDLSNNGVVNHYTEYHYQFRIHRSPNKGHCICRNHTVLTSFLIPSYREEKYATEK